ncbi:MAG: sulfite exporter TauE/SafE family protein [Rhodobacteraceae bacterium]|nr:sulfite exporter TauE/SafE family protein [Paracoccaceae bacterium]
MLDAFDYPQLAFLSASTFLAALVRGFSGFGSGLVYLPLAAQVLTPFQALTTIVIFDLIGPLPIVRRASRDCELPDLFRLVAGLVVALPLGLFTLTLLPPEAFRFAVSFVALFLLVCLGLGLRYGGTLAPPLIYGTGAMSGFLQGVAGLPGPPVILLYMASTRPVQVIRANTLLFLFTTDVVLLPALAIFGRLDGSAIALGMFLILPNLLGGLVGAKLFRPEHERTYRVIAYSIIAASAISGLPVWG